MKLPDPLSHLGRIGLVGERRALALLCMGFYAALFALMGLIALGQLPEWAPCFLGLAACYVIGFFAVAAEWFWGRWYAIGLGYSGLTMAVMAAIASRTLPTEMAVFGGMHGLVALCLWGEKMAARYDAKPGWRERLHLDERAAVKLRKSVTRAGTSLPSLVLFALAPRQETALLTLAALSLAVLGLGGLVRGRTWGVLALGGAALGVLFAVVSPADFSTGPVALAPLLRVEPRLGLLAGFFLFAAVVPFLRSIASYLFNRSCN